MQPSKARLKPRIIPIAAALSASAGLFAVAPVHAQTALVVVTETLDAPDTTTTGSLIIPTDKAPSGLASLFISTANAATVNVKKVVNGQFAVMADKGWVIYQGTQGNPTLNFYNQDTSGGFLPGPQVKLKTSGAGTANSGDYFAAGGVVFMPCPVQPLPVRCAPSNQGEDTGVPVGYGELIVQGGGQGSSNGGWVSDNQVKSSFTSAPYDVPTFNPGTIAGVAYDSVNGAYAVGRDLALSGEHGIILKLDSAGQTYRPIARTDLGTLGGATSQALGISKNAKYVVGAAFTASNKQRAVYALTTGTAWIDMTTLPGFPTTVGGKPITKSRALAVSDSGFVAGTLTVKKNVPSANRVNVPVDAGFVYDLNTNSIKVFNSADADLVPLKVMTDGKVVGNLEFLVPKGSPAGTKHSNHPFLFDGASIVDFGTMEGTFGCRVNRPNNLGELAGTCIVNAIDEYGVGGRAFYLDALAGSPSFLDLNAALHALNDASVAEFRPYSIGTASSIDDDHELSLVGVKFVAGNPNRAAFLASKQGYNP